MNKLEADHAHVKSKHGFILNLLIEEIDSMKALPPPSKKRIGFNTKGDGTISTAGWITPLCLFLRGTGIQNRLHVACGV